MLSRALGRSRAPAASLVSKHFVTALASRASGSQLTNFTPSWSRQRFSTSAAAAAAVDDKEDDEDSDAEDSDLDEEDVEEAIDYNNMTPKDIVKELDKHIVGQPEAKRAVALALRNRWRRKKLDPTMRDEVMPKNILMIGPTGVGKTEIARRLAKLVNAPFIKVEATKYTEIGFHGKDVDSIIRDLVEQALTLTKTKRRLRLQKTIDRNVERKILDALVCKGDPRTRKDFKVHYRKGLLEDQTVNIEVPTKEAGGQGDMGNMNPQNVMINLNSKTLMQGGAKTQKRKLKVSECKPLIEEMEMERLVNTDDVLKEAMEAVQQDGIVFIDEIDKICSSSDRHSADASAEGVQRDLLPLIEGSTISTKHGNVETDHILFIASGAFHSVKPSDLLAELQGRLPIRVNLNPLKEEDFVRIMVEPENNLIKQQIMLMGTEDVTLNVDSEAIREMAKVAFECNATIENIGARRLHTVIEAVVSDLSYSAADRAGETITITSKDVRTKTEPLLKSKDLKKFLL
jgi:ATP-dependent HslUV protease ATP-binding subunit HslU